jgi:hypothetical protein
MGSSIRPVRVYGTGFIPPAGSAAKKAYDDLAIRERRKQATSNIYSCIEVVSVFGVYYTMFNPSVQLGVAFILVCIAAAIIIYMELDVLEKISSDEVGVWLIHHSEKRTPLPVGNRRIGKP